MYKRNELIDVLMEIIYSGKLEERHIDAIYDAIDYINAHTEKAKPDKTYICLEDVMKFPIRKEHHDTKHGNEHFIYGIETMMEYIETLPRYTVS